MVGDIIDVIEERMRFPWRQGAIRFPVGKVVPVIMLPSMLWLATLHPYLVVFTFFLLLPAVFLIAVRTVISCSAAWGTGHQEDQKRGCYWDCTCNVINHMDTFLINIISDIQSDNG